MEIKNKKIAIVYDWIDSWGGVERVLLTFHEMFSNADFYTSYVDYDKASWSKNLKIKTSFIQNLPDFIKKSRKLSFPLYPYAFESFNFSDYDVVISVTSSFAKAVITKPETRHICYLLTPTRYLWLYSQQYLTGWQSALGKSYFNEMKRWDYIAAQRPDKIIAISQTVTDRCKKYYNREAKVIYPGFDIDYWKKIQNSEFRIQNKNLESRIKQKYFLIVSRLEPYKRVDLAVDVFNQTGKNLMIVGKGTQINKLKQLAKLNIQFVSDLSDQKLAVLYTQAEGLIMPQEEDFGYVSLEAQFFGCPVIAYEKGGALETVAKDKGGIFFHAQTNTCLKQALKKYDKIKEVLKQNLKVTGDTSFDKYSLNRFKKDFITQLIPNNK